MNDYEKYCMRFDSCKRCPLNKDCEREYKKEIKRGGESGKGEV